LIEVEVEDEAWLGAMPDVEALAERAAIAALANGVESDAASGIVILLAADDAIRELNARFRGQDKPTNVLSFPAPPNPEGCLGDIALAYGVCAHEAEAQGKAFGDHLQHLVAHGVLHLLGYDHTDDADAERMESLERVILAGLGIADPYAAEQDDHG
jgi:probable rRNA maturation factor